MKPSGFGISSVEWFHVANRHIHQRRWQPVVMRWIAWRRIHIWTPRLLQEKLFKIDATHRDHDCSHISGLLLEVFWPQDSWWIYPRTFTSTTLTVSKEPADSTGYESTGLTCCCHQMVLTCLCNSVLHGWTLKSLWRIVPTRSTSSGFARWRRVLLSCS